LLGIVNYFNTEFYILKKLIIILVILLTYSVTKAQVKYVNEFLNIGVGAEAFGKGNAHIAGVQDVTAGYWNPSQLVYLENNLEVGLMHSEYFAGLAAYDYGSVGFNIDDKTAMGVTFMRFGVDDIPNTLDLVDANGNFNFDRISTFSSTDNAILISYARKTKVEGLSLGGNTKLLYRRVGSFANAYGFGFDFSGTYIKNNWRFAAVMRDAIGTFSAWRFNTDDLEEVFLRTGNEIPANSIETAVPRLILGSSYNYKIDEDFAVSPEINLDITFDGKRNVLLKTDFASADIRFGLQANYRKLIFLRMGIQNIQQEQFISGKQQTTFQPNIGLGFRLKKVAIDYALTDIANQSAALYSHVFSLRIGINKRQ